jgi:hypothetical protein
MSKCKICGTIHDEIKCFLIKAFEYYPDGSLKRIEYLTPSDILSDKPQPSLASVLPFGTRQ